MSDTNVEPKNKQTNNGIFNDSMKSLIRYGLFAILFAVMDWWIPSIICAGFTILDAIVITWGKENNVNEQ